MRITSHLDSGIVPLLLAWALPICCQGQHLPKGYLVPAITLSPDHRYGITVPANQLATARN